MLKLAWTKRSYSSTPLAVVLIHAMCACGGAAEFIPLVQNTPASAAINYYAVSDDGSTVVGQLWRKQPIPNDVPNLPTGSYGMIWTREGGIEALAAQLGTARGMDIIDIAGDNETMVGNRQYYVPVVDDFYLEAIKLTRDSRTPLAPPSGYTSASASYISRDGQVVVGRATKGYDLEFDVDDEQTAVYWDEQNNVHQLEGNGFIPVDAYGVSANGSVMVGPATGYLRSFRWTPGTGGQLLPLLSPQHTRSVVWDISADGRWSVGWSGTSGTQPLELQAVRWDGFSEPVPLLPPQNGWGSRAVEVSDDGSIILGTLYPSNDFEDLVVALWTEETGFVPLEDLLMEKYELGAQFAGWDLDVEGNSFDMSGDGRFILGVGMNPQEESQFYLVDLSTGISGDFNGDDKVDAADYVVWRDGLGADFTQTDYDTWRANFGRSATGSALGAPTALPNSTNPAVPEPQTLQALLHAMLLIYLLRRADARSAALDNSRAAPWPSAVRQLTGVCLRTGLDTAFPRRTG